MIPAKGLFLAAARHRIRLKWHVLRSAPGLAAHDRDSLALGLARGALMEVDLQLTSDDHWVCLHDETLEAETTGSGRVAMANRAQIEQLRQRGPDGRPMPSPPLFLDELSGMLGQAGGAARIQLDLKVEQRAFKGAARARFGAAVAPLASRFDIGAHDWAAVQELAALAPGCRPGFDPFELAPAHRFADRETAGSFARLMLEAAPEASMLYLYHGLVTSAADLGVDLVGIAHAHGREVDCWTIDPGLDGLEPLIRHLFAVGCDQLTTNAPEALETWWRQCS